MTTGRMTWDEIVDQYPERWVAISDAEMDGADIISSIVEAVLTDEEVGEYREQAAPGLLFDRTTEGKWYRTILFLYLDGNDNSVKIQGIYIAPTRAERRTVMKRVMNLVTEQNSEYRGMVVCLSLI